MLKALLLDMDETLCDTLGANQRAKNLLAEAAEGIVDSTINGNQFATAYVKGIYRNWNAEQEARYLPIAEQQSERAFRIQLICDLLAEQGVVELSQDAAEMLQDKFDTDRIAAFDFYPGIREFLIEARKLFTLVVITNGPEYSQIPKVEAIRLHDYVDHVIIGGQEPEQKPAASIFYKALKLADCEASEAIHVGDSLHTDILGAHNSGITSVWIQHQQPLDSELDINPHHTVMGPEEIPALITKLGANP